MPFRGFRIEDLNEDAQGPLLKGTGWLNYKVFNRGRGPGGGVFKGFSSSWVM